MAFMFERLEVYQKAVDLADEMAAKSEGFPRGRWVRVPGSGWPGDLMPLATCLYKFVRCKLVHEEGLPDNVEFFENTPPGSLALEVTADRLRMQNSIMQGLSRAVTFAPENAALFPEYADAPADVVGWMLFGHTRDKRKLYMQQRAARVGRAGGSAV